MKLLAPVMIAAAILLIGCIGENAPSKPAGTVNCFKDLSCFREQLRHCSKAKYSGLLFESVTEILGITNGECLISLNSTLANGTLAISVDDLKNVPYDDAKFADFMIKYSKEYNET